MDGAWKFVHVLALKLDPAWRRLPDEVRLHDAAGFERTAIRATERVRTLTYSIDSLPA